MSNTIDMLASGHLTRRLILFALPIMAGAILQQSFNAVDVAVIGHFVGSEAVAAVGTNTPVISLIINLFMGVSVGSNVVIANYLGSRDDRAVHRAVACSMALALIFGVGLLLLGWSIARPALQLLSTPDYILDRAVRYLQIFACGFPAMMIFNFGSAILRSVGDTRRPFYWLCAGGVLNVCLNLLFVLGMGMEVEGVAIATVVANYLSATGVIILLLRDKGPVRVSLRQLRLHRHELSKILRIGVPAGLQGMVFALSNSFIQSGINSFGHEAMAGSAAATNFELYTYFVISAFGQAATAFIAQNLGAGRIDRIAKIYGRCMALAVAGALCLNVGFTLTSRHVLSVFIQSPAAIEFGVIRIEHVLLFQFIACSYEIAGASMRALGYSMTPTVLVILGTCVLRVCWASSGPYAQFGDLLMVYPLSWVLTGTAVLIAYHLTYHRLTKK